MMNLIQHQYIFVIYFLKINKVNNKTFTKLKIINSKIIIVLNNFNNINNLTNKITTPTQIPIIQASKILLMQ